MGKRDVQFAQGSYYHLYNRGANHQSIFLEDANYVFVLRKMKDYAKQFSIAVISYCLMPNHYHWLVRQDGETSASMFVQRVFNSYGKAFNKRFERTGTLFEGKFEAIHVDETEYLLHLCRYIHTNPIKHGFAYRADEWQFSNYLEWVGKRDGALVDRAFVREYFPNPADYIRFVEEYRPPINPALDG